MSLTTKEIEDAALNFCVVPDGDGEPVQDQWAYECFKKGAEWAVSNGVKPSCPEVHKEDTRVITELKLEIDRLKVFESYNTVCYDLIEMLKPFDKGPGNPNTVWALTKQVTEELLKLRRAYSNMVCVLKTALDPKRLRDFSTLASNPPKNGGVWDVQVVINAALEDAKREIERDV